jgi:hypothetical protein
MKQAFQSAKRHLGTGIAAAALAFVVLDAQSLAGAPVSGKERAAALAAEGGEILDRWRGDQRKR